MVAIAWNLGFYKLRIGRELLLRSERKYKSILIWFSFSERGPFASSRYLSSARRVGPVFRFLSTIRICQGNKRTRIPFFHFLFDAIALYAGAIIRIRTDASCSHTAVAKGTKITSKRPTSATGRAAEILPVPVRIILFGMGSRLKRH